ncbi:MAG: HEAT repeat domain-containing protein [Methanospirillum sp.]
MGWLDFILARVEPARLMARLKEHRDIAALERLLERGDPSVRHLAAVALGDLGDPAALDALLAALAGPDEEGVRWRAAEGLARLGGPAVAGLATLAEDGDPDVRWKAIVALGDIGDPRAGPALRARLADSDRFVRGRAVSALARLGAPCLPLMFDALADPDPRVRQGAAEVLGLLGDPAGVDGLLQALRDPTESVRRAAAVALLRINPAD